MPLPRKYGRQICHDCICLYYKELRASQKIPAATAASDVYKNIQSQIHKILFSLVQLIHIPKAGMFFAVNNLFPAF
jgi:hypothetical protein